MPLRLLVPPRTRPRGMRWVRPAVPGLWRRDILPVDVGAPEREVLTRDADRLAIVGATRFQEEDRSGWVRREPVGQRATRRTGPDDDEIVPISRHWLTRRCQA